MMDVKKEVLLAWLAVLPRNRGIKNFLAGDIERLQRLWHGDEEELVVLKNTNLKFFEGIISDNNAQMAKIAYERCLEFGIEIITQQDNLYPEMLKNTDDAPAVLFYKGDIRKCKDCISVIGSRKATAYGIRVAREISEILAAKGACIVSGLARGIDSAAHIGALKVEGATCGVIGAGIDVVYPPENEGLMNEIFQKGVVISEYIPGTLPLPQNFPARNRLISGLSKGLIVVEAGRESGTLITVDFALEQGRDVYAVPGNIYSSKSEGTNNLIRDGAKIVVNIDEIAKECGISVSKADKTSKLRKYIVESIESGAFDVDETVNSTKCKISEINSELGKMLFEGVVCKNADGEYWII